MVFLKLDLALSLLIVAANAQFRVHPRQAAPPSPSPSPVPSSSFASSSSQSGPSSGPASAPPSISISGTASPATSPPPTFPISIASTNPTAIPIGSITVNSTPQATVPLDFTYPAGAQPTLIQGAPPLPDISTINPANYPPLDKPPPTDSPEVQQWIQRVKASGFAIPNIPPTLPGGCPANPLAVADTSRCWWTCNQCTRNTDIITCPEPMTWGSSFDDGPAPYTPNLIQYLDEKNLKTTFFVVGSRVISRPTYLQTQYMGGHQIAVHTWSHSPLTTQSTEQVIAELYWSKKVIKDVIGVTPNVFRPPFGDIDDRIRAIAASMGLTAIVWTSGIASKHVSFDTRDFDIGAGLISASGVVNEFNNILSNASRLPTGFIVLEHDLFQQSVDLATGYTIPEALALNFKLMPIVQCLNKPLSDAYIETNNNVTNPPLFASGSSIMGGAATTLAPGGTSSPSPKGNGALDTPLPLSGAWGALAVVLCTMLGTVTVLR